MGVGRHDPDQLTVIDVDRAPRATSRQRPLSAMETPNMLQNLNMLIQKSRAYADLALERMGRLVRHAMLVCATAGLATAYGGSDAKQPALHPIDVAAMQGTVERLAKEMLVPGAVVILRTPNGEFTITYGVTTYRGTVPTSVEQHVRVGSNTKTWTGTVILQQVQEGRLRLDDPVSKYRPDVPNGEQITIEQLLAMRSGLYQLHDDARTEPDARRPARERLDTGRAAGARLQVPADLRARHGVRLLEHQHGPARPHRRAARRRQAARRHHARSAVRAPGSEEHAVPRHRVERDPRALRRAATCTVTTC